MELDEAVARSRAQIKILGVIRPGDVVNYDSRDKWWQIHKHIAHGGIRRHQYNLFGPESRWRDTHCMLYFDPGRSLSVEPPRAKWAGVFEYALDRITIWRYTGRAFDDNDLRHMFAASEKLVGTVYDIGQLLDIAANHLLGYPNSIRYRIFDWSSRMKVCSVGVRAAFEHLRKQLPEGVMNRLFESFRYAAWAEAGKIQKLNTFGRGVDVEATAPAHFANSRYFADEFRFVAGFDRGERIA